MNAFCYKISTATSNDFGEIKETRIETKHRIQSEPYYYKGYMSDELAKNICSLDRGEGHVLTALLAMVDYKNTIYVVGTNRKRIEYITGFTHGTIRNNIKGLCDKKIIKRISMGEYMLNPELFARGTWKDILTMEY